jgi:P63C domain
LAIDAQKTIIMKVLYGSPTQLLKINSIELECYILENNLKVIGKKKLDKIFGLDSKTESSLFDFITSISKNISVSNEIFDFIKAPVSFISILEDATEKTLLGYNASLLIPVCNCIVKAKSAGYISLSHLKTAKIAEKILKGLETKLLTNWIDEVTGFTFFKENTKEQFKNYLLKIKKDTAFEWVVTFTDGFYEDMFLFMSSNWQELKENPIKIADFIYSLVFLRIDNAVLEELRNTKPKRSYVSKNGALLNREHPKLQIFNQTLQAFLKEASFERSEFMQLLIKNYPKNTLRENLIFEQDDTQSLTLFNEKLKTGLMVNKS